MWHNNGFSNNGKFPDNIDNPEDPPAASFAGSSNLTNGFPPLLSSNISQYENANGAQFKDFPPDASLYNQGAFMQNQQVMTADPQLSPPAYSLPRVNAIPRPMLDARAAELRERLMKGREARGNSATPPVARATKLNLQAIGSSPAAAILSKPLFAAPPNPAQDLQELISSFSDSPPTPSGNTAQINNHDSSKLPTTLRVPTGPSTLAKSQELSLGSPTKASELSTNGNTGGTDLTSNIGSRNASRRGSISDISEGEILEDVVSKETRHLPGEEKRSEDITTNAKTIEATTREFHDEALSSSQNLEQRECLPSHRAPPSNPRALNHRSPEDREVPRGDRRPDHYNGFDTRSERRSFQSESRYERNIYPEPDKRAYARRSSRDEEFRSGEPKVEQKRDEKQQVLQSQTTPPTLEQLLPHDRDVREWLEITGYHYVDYRNKILNRRRQIARLDAERERLIAEMTEEERGGVPRPNQSMFPPPFPPKSAAFEPLPTPTIAAAREAQREALNSNKRSYSEMQDPDKDAGPEKMPRREDRGRSREQEVVETRRTRSRGESGSRFFSDRRGEDRGVTYNNSNNNNNNNRYDERRSRRSQSREQQQQQRDDSPAGGRRAHENRSLARTRSFDDDMREQDTPRTGPYQGFNNIPSFQGRGRGGGGNGRGRGLRGGGNGGGYQGYNSEQPPSGPRAANGKPYKDPTTTTTTGFDRGRNGAASGSGQ